ncbi:MAG: hypothetical protein J5506_01950 [Prevotella sp.]|nr:hypothetical protein [Prevotella sp.]
MFSKKQKKTESRKQRSAANTQEADNRVRLCADGKYRWVFEMPLLRNPSVFFDVWVVMAMSCAIVFVIIMLIMLFSGDIGVLTVKGTLEGVAFGLAGMTVLSILGYLLYAAMNGGKYLVLFIMDEHEIVHKQMPKTVKKATLIGKLTMLAGAAAGKPGVVGTGMLAKSRTSLTSDYDDVRQLVAHRRMNVIKVNERWFKNRVYVEDADFDFVYDYLCQHCPNAKH